MPPSPNKNKSFTSSPAKSAKGRLAGLVGVLILLGLCLAVVVYRQPLNDWWRLRGYRPPSDISRLADQDTMTPYARRLFYLNNPQLVSSVTSFRKDCPENEDAIVLGCYHPGENGIYIYNVKTPDLQGVAQVTAAHEDLHAIYERLSDKDRQHVDSLLQNYYQHGLTNQRVKDEISLYKKTEPNSVLDEMHSTFGTEVDNLPPALETYYKQYFSNRAGIVALSDRYEEAFTDRQAQISQDDQRLAAMKEQIDSQQAALQSQLQKLNDTQDHLKALLDAGQTEEYNAGVPDYNSQVQSYNGSVAALRSSIASYNQLVKARNVIAQQLTDLDKALDTRMAPKAQSSAAN
ncbi:MAG TPA: hypothetical protein VHA05_03605 [Candidatus Saccharimonadales bacterium]|nr:hypothetical protein [Candidatus Saccharimonadales bacterium]